MTRTRWVSIVCSLVCAAAIGCGSGPQSAPNQPPAPGDPNTPPPPVDGPATNDAPPETAPSPPAKPTPPSPPTAKTPGPKGILKGILTSHNRVRARHCVPPLKWSPKLAAYAQQWATTLRDQNCAFKHRPRSPYGENLSMFGPPGGTNADEITMGWYNEIKSYSFSKAAFSFQTGHFTQVVWRTTTELGCGRAVCKGAEIWVCNYAPPGNVQGEYKRNVPPPCKR